MNIYAINKDEIEKSLKEIWDYMNMSQSLEKSDLIIGCGCANLDIPIRCAYLLKKGYASKILFVGGLGKITKNNFNKSEAEIYKDIAISNGIKEEDILIETKSTNTGDNFKFAMKLLEKNNVKCNKIIIVHKSLNERRTYSTAKMVLKDKELMITSPNLTFEEYLKELKEKSIEDINNEISVIVGDIQRMIIYPQFGWQIKNEVPDSIIKRYTYLKNLGFTKCILNKQQIKSLIAKYGIIEGESENYFN